MVGTIVNLTLSLSIGDVKLMTIPCWTCLSSCAPFTGTVEATSGLAIVRNVQRTSSFVAAILFASCAPDSSTGLYGVLNSKGWLGVNRMLVPFHSKRPAMPCAFAPALAGSRRKRCSTDAASIGVLNVTVIGCVTPANWVLSSGLRALMAGVAVLKENTNPLSDWPSISVNGLTLTL